MSARFSMRTCDRCERQVLATADGRCPRCAEPVASDGPAASVEVTLSRTSPLPHLCMQCGAETHRIAHLRVRGPRPQVARRPEHEFESALDPAIGPYKLIALAVSVVCLVWDELYDLVFKRPPTIHLRTRQCRACRQAGNSPSLTPHYTTRRLSFEAHPRFAAALAQQTRDAERARSAKAVPPRGDERARRVNPS